MATNKNLKHVVALLEDSATQKLARDTKNLAICELFENGFIASEPNGPRQIHSKLLIQAFTQLSTMMKFLDFKLVSPGRGKAQMAITTAGVSTIMDNGGLDSVMRDKGGVFQNQLLYGNGYFAANANEDEAEKKEVPIVFSNYINSNVVLDNNATRMRGRAGKAVQRALVFSPFEIDEAKRIFGEDVIGDAKGKIPRNNAELEALDKQEEQQNSSDKNIEIGYHFDISLDFYYVFAGQEGKEIELKENEEYPFKKKGKSYIPIFDFICMPSAKGVTDHGIGDYIYELAIVTQRLNNLGIGHAYEGANPLKILNLPEGEADKFAQKLEDAYAQRAKGQEAYVPVEYNKLSPGVSAVQTTSTVVQSLVAEWQSIFERLVGDLKRIGINIDAVDRQGKVTATQIISEETARTAFVQQMMEYNASETQEFVEVVIDLIKENVSSKNDTPINTVIRIHDDEVGEVEVDNITYGDVADELRKHTYYVVVNSRTGAIPSNIMKQAQIVRSLGALTPGTPAYVKLLREFMALNDHDFTLEDFGLPQQAQPQPELPGGAVPAGTDRTAVNVRKPDLEPVL